MLNPLLDADWNGSIDVGGRLPNLMKFNESSHRLAGFSHIEHRNSALGNGAVRKPPQRFLSLVRPFLAAKVTSTLALCELFAQRSCVRSKFSNAFHGTILR